MRAALTILGVAIGVVVVMVIGALIAGFDKGVSDMLASLGPKTFYVGRFWGGTGQEDPDDPNPWRRRPPLTLAEAERLEALPTIKFVVVDENARADVEFEGKRLGAGGIQGRDAGLPYDVIGVYLPPTGLFGEGDQNEVYIPYGTLVKYVPYWQGWMDFFVAPEDSVPLPDAIDDVTIALRSMRGLRPAQPNTFDVLPQA